jgi:hypothetical protein
MKFICATPTSHVEQEDVFCKRITQRKGGRGQHWEKIRLRQNLGEIRRVVRPRTHHAVMHRNDFLGDLYQVAQPIML